MPAALLPLLDAALRGVVIALLLLLAAVLGRDRPGLPVARAGVVLALGQCVQLVSSAPFFEAQVPRLWQAPWLAVSVGNAVLFWVFAKALFDDAFRVRPWHLAAWAAVAVLALVNCAVPSATGPLALGLQRAVPLVFAVLAALAAASHWREDLVERRRRLRMYIVATGIGYSLAMLAVRLASPEGRLSSVSATADVAMLLLIVAPVAWRMLRLARSDLFPPAPTPAPLPASAAPAAAPEPRAEAAPDPAEDRLAQALQQLMAVERAYRMEDLSIAGLAARLGVPEYRLRRLINGRLGHRNFSAFVNGFRLEEARTALADPARRELPVLTIALTAGFQSIGPFNRAFKAATGLTPTEFRRQKLADS